MAELKATPLTGPSPTADVLIVGPSLGTSVEALWTRCAAMLSFEVVGWDLLSNMSWTFEEMTAYAARGTAIRPGDVLGSGTCGNGGCLAELWGTRGAQAPPPLKPGDTVTLTAEGIGSVRNTVIEGTGHVPLPTARKRPRTRP